MGHERFLFQLADTDKKITLCLSVRDFHPKIHDELVTASSASEPSPHRFSADGIWDYSALTPAARIIFAHFSV